MKTGLACIGLATLCCLPSIAQSKTPPAPTESRALATVRLQFVNTDVSDVLQAISVKTHANIVYPALLKRMISLNITAGSVGEAIGYAASAAGLTWKQLGPTFVVAPASDLKQMIESFGQSEVVERNDVPAADAITLLTGALPYLTVRPAGRQLLLIGSPEDIVQARALLAVQEKPVPAQPTVSEVMTLRRLVAKDAATMVQTLYPGLKADAVGGTEKTGGAIGLSGISAQVDAARGMLRKLDDDTSGAPQVGVHRIYTIRYSSAGVLRTFLEKTMTGVTAVAGPEQYAPPQPNFRPLSGATSSSAGGGSSGSSGSSSGGSGGSGGSSGGSSEGATGGAGGEATKAGGPDRSRVLVLSGPAEEVESALRLLGEVDTPPQQVMIEVKVVDISTDKAVDLGVKWDWSPLNFLEYPAGTLLKDVLPSQPHTSTGNRLTSFSKVPFTFQAILSAMVTRREAKILAKPSIQVLDNDDANIFIGDTLRTQVSQSGITGTTVQVFEFPVGIILLVRPRVNVDGQITMRVHPVVSTVTGIGAGNLPQTSTREAETTVRVKDGETMVIGGLIRDEMSKVVQEVPFLAKLPLVGELFRSNSTTHRKSEIMVFITPHLVK
jgi:type II secretory pathway component GspD/PulD (secretin)